jgi:Na+-translocating ferredoxin:NAD+ oxidoreductase subunit D
MTGPELAPAAGPPWWRTGRGTAERNHATLAALAPVGLAAAIVHGFGPGPHLGVGPGSDLNSTALRLLVRELGLPVGMFNLAGALGVLLLPLAAGLALDALFRIWPSRSAPPAGQAPLAGLLLGLLLPANVAAAILPLGLLAAAISYYLFNRRLRYPLNSAAVGWLCLSFLFPGQVFPMGMRSMAALHPLVVYLTAAGGMALCALGYVKWRVPLGVAAGAAGAMAVVSFTGPAAAPAGNVFPQLIAGHFALAAFFLAPDSESSPANGAAMVLFGIGVGALMVAAQVLGPWPDAAPMAVVAMNLASPLLDRIRPRPRETVDAG